MAKAKKPKNDKPKGKWGHLVGVLPKLEKAETPERQDQIDLLRQEIIEEYQKEHDGAVPTSGYLVDQYLACRDAKDAVKAQLHDLELELETLTKMITDNYEAEGISNLHTSDGASVGMHYEPFVVVKDKDANRQWAVKNGLERLLSLPWQTLNSEVKAALESGKAVYDGEKLVGGPDGVDVFLVTKFTKRG